MLTIGARSGPQGIRQASLLFAACGLSSCTLFSSPEPPPPPPPPAPVAAVIPPAPPAPHPDMPVDPEHIKGLDQDETLRWLGKPQQNLEAPPATVWHYVGQSCELDVYFYLDLQHKIMRALHYEVKSDDTSDRRNERCFQQFVWERSHREGD
jgi:hypothetical protein